MTDEKNSKLPEVYELMATVRTFSGVFRESISGVTRAFQTPQCGGGA